MLLEASIEVVSLKTFPLSQHLFDKNFLLMFRMLLVLTLGIT
jgi:hypothetical protein